MASVPSHVRYGVLCGLMLSSVAHMANAEERVATETVGATPDALPGLLRVGTPAPGVRNVTLAASAGYGYTEEVLNDNDSHQRLSGRLAASVRLIPWLTLAGSLDGRWDMHSSDSGDDSGLVGDPRLRIRAGTEIAPGFSLGAQVSVWLPGASAPSIEFDATTIDGVVMSSYDIGVVTLAAQAGFRWDNSANAVDDADELSLNDRLSLGLSDFNSVLTGLGIVGRIDTVELLAEGSWEPWVGSGAPSLGNAPLRVAAGARWQPITDTPLKLHLMAEGLVSSRPEVGVGSPLVPIEPRFTAWLGVSYMIPLEKSEVKEAPPPVAPVVVQAKPAPPVLGKVNVNVKDENGNPLAAMVRWQQTEQMRELQTDVTGQGEITALPPGILKVTIEAEGYKPREETAQVKAGETAQLTVSLERALPVGQIRGYVRSYKGSGLAANVRIEPIGVELRAGEDGGFEADVPPGRYEVVITMPGFRNQKRRVQVQERGVTVLNVDLREAKASEGR